MKRIKSFVATRCEQAKYFLRRPVKQQTVCPQEIDNRVRNGILLAGITQIHLTGCNLHHGPQVDFGAVTAFTDHTHKPNTDFGNPPVSHVNSSADSDAHVDQQPDEPQQTELQLRHASHEAALQPPDAVTSQELGGQQSALQLDLVETTAAVVQEQASTALKARSSPAVHVVAKSSPGLAVIYEGSSQDEPVQLDSVADLPHSADPAAEYNSRVKVGHASETSMLCRNWGT